MDKKSYVIAVDVGSSNVVVAVGTMAEGGVLNIEALVSEPTEGVSAGMVDNSKSVGQSLRHARERAEKEAGITITDAYVGISGKFVRSARYTDHVFVEDVDNCISQRDVNALMERMRNVKAADGEMIMDLFPISYRGDSGVEMRNPVGCYSKQLSSTYNFILCEHMAKDRLRRVFLDAGIKIKGMFANAAVVADSVVSTDEKDEGVAVVDIGGGVTDVAIYYGGALRHIVSIPIGGTAVNGDIRAYGIPEKQVEKLFDRPARGGNAGRFMHDEARCRERPALHPSIRLHLPVRQDTIPLKRLARHRVSLSMPYQTNLPGIEIIYPEQPGLLVKQDPLAGEKTAEVPL